MNCCRKGEGGFNVRRGKSFLLLALLAAVFACAGSEVPTDPGSPPPPPPVTTVLLKDIVIPNLPSPYYHFEYDATGRITAASFASGLTMYDVAYDGGRISEMTNNILVNHDRLVYVYDTEGRVAVVEYVDSTGPFTHVVFSYDGPRLTGVERNRRVPGGFIIDKTMTLSYYADGNLRQITEHRPAIDGVQEEATYVDLFEQYDSGINVDAFSLLHDDFFDHLVLLPDVQLQLGNPRRQTRSGDGTNFVADYSYTYDELNRPLSKTWEVTILNGPTAGVHFQTNSAFSYYP